MSARKARQIAIRILDEFGDLLDEKNVTIPLDDKEGMEEEARLYGSEYYTLEDAITAILVEETTGRKIDDGPGLLEG
jgi:CRISPR/Cas system CMR-associated protein Cmr3 (group 5 of RAMP superfamily)